MSMIPLGVFLALIAANFFSHYLSGKEVLIYVGIFLASFLLPTPAPTVVAVVLDLILIMKFKMEHF